MTERDLTDQDLRLYEWQMWTKEFGPPGQTKLKNASVLVSRIGGVGGNVAQQLAAAGVGKIVLAHAGNLRDSDLNRQVLMSHDGLGQSRVEQAAQRLRAFNPTLEIVAVAENITEENVERLVGGVDVVVACAPRFRERLLMNRAAVRHNKPLVDCAMFEMETQVTTVIPGQSPCLACLYPVEPPDWKREFPVFGAVAGVAGCLGAMEAIKVLSGLGQPLGGTLFTCDLGDMTAQRLTVKRRPDCPVCGT